MISFVMTVSPPDATHFNVEVFDQVLTDVLEKFSPVEVVIVVCDPMVVDAGACRRIVSRFSETRILIGDAPMDSSLGVLMGVESSLGDVIVACEWPHIFYADVKQALSLIEAEQSDMVRVFCRDDLRRARTWRTGRVIRLLFRLANQSPLLGQRPTLYVMTRELGRFLTRTFDAESRLNRRELAPFVSFHDIESSASYVSSKSLADRGDLRRVLRMVVTSEGGAMRLTTGLGVIGSAAAIAFAAFAFTSFVLREELAPGWTTLALLLATILLLQSLFFFIAGEFLIAMFRSLPVGARLRTVKTFRGRRDGGRHKNVLEALHAAEEPKS
jgi:hypothetical protein